MDLSLKIRFYQFPKNKLILTFCILITSLVLLNAQNVISINNPSFDGKVKKGSPNSDFISYWLDCSKEVFPNESSPDIHGTRSRMWLSNQKPKDGETFLGLVTRDNDTHEFISQKLTQPFSHLKNYRFTISLSKSLNYVSRSRLTNDQVNYNKPIVLRIWGGNEYCQKAQLLAETPIIDHLEWKEYQFLLEPFETLDFITLEAFWETPSLLSYCGNILLDDIQKILIVEK